MKPPKPPSRPDDEVSLWRYMGLFRKDILSAQPERLYRAWMAEFKTPFFRSYLINDPDVLGRILQGSVEDFPKSGRISEGLRPLLGQSVFLTNGADWARQRRIIDPAFEGGRLREVLPSILEAGQAAIARLKMGEQEMERLTSYAAADVIFRTLFSLPIEDHTAQQVFDAFRDYQRTQPLLNIGAFLPVPVWIPRFHRRRTKRTARSIRALIWQLTDARRRAIEAGTAPDDLASKIMTTVDPQTGKTFDVEEMVDQIAIFFLAGHETSASALAWALYLVALYPEWQERIADEAQGFSGRFEDLATLKISRDVFRETLRLYPPVPMMVREVRKCHAFRGRKIKAGAQLVISPWHLHRQNRLWEAPDDFNPGRWAGEKGKTCLRHAYIPFSKGPRVCPGAGFAMIEGPVLLAMLVAKFHFKPIPHRVPVPVAHLTLRSQDGIWLECRDRI